MTSLTNLLINNDPLLDVGLVVTFSALTLIAGFKLLQVFRRHRRPSHMDEGEVWYTY